MQNIRNLRVWHEARALARDTYAITRNVSRRDFPGLVSQLQRAATSIGGNIAEGAAHRSQREFARYLQQALASAAEVEHHLHVAMDIGMLPSAEVAAALEQARRVQRMLVALDRRVRSDGAANRSGRARSDESM
jgi:four helix bundle protein